MDRRRFMTGMLAAAGVAVAPRAEGCERLYSDQWDELWFFGGDEEDKGRTFEDLPIVQRIEPIRFIHSYPCGQ